MGRRCPQLGAPLTSGLICCLTAPGLNTWEEVRSVQDHKAPGCRDRKGGEWELPGGSKKAGKEEEGQAIGRSGEAIRMGNWIWAHYNSVCD